MFNFFSKKRALDRVAKKVYNYHNLGVGLFPDGEEKTPHGSGERYNFDRMYMMVSNYDFTHKNFLDIGCNSGWFCFQVKLLGAKNAIGIDYEKAGGIMGPAINYAEMLEKRLKIGTKFYNQDLEKTDINKILQDNKIDSFDCAIIYSVLHHIDRKKELCSQVYNAVKEVIFYEDHEFWNEVYGKDGKLLEVKGEGHRFGWNEDMEWQRKISAIEDYEDKIIKYYMTTDRKDYLMLDKFKKIKFLGFSEKRRPVLALYK